MIFLRDALLMLLLAGGLHLYLFTFRKQGKKLKYDPRPELEKSSKFSFRNLVYDNMFWSLTSGVTVRSRYEVFYFWGAANGVIPKFVFSQHPIVVICWLLVLPFFLSTHFYFVHQLLHWPPLFKVAHKSI